MLENSMTEYLQKIRCNGNEKKYTMPQTHILKSSREIARYAFLVERFTGSIEITNEKKKRAA